MKLNIFNYEMYEYGRMECFSHSEQQYNELPMQQKTALASSYTCPLSAPIGANTCPLFTIIRIFQIYGKNDFGVLI